MVAKIAAPEHDMIATLNSVLAERKRHLRFYEAIKDDLIAQFLSYEENNGNPEIISPLTIRNYTRSDDEAEKRKKSLLNLYLPKVDKHPFDVLSEMRRKHGLLFCPSCGEDGAPGTLDHYLPKEHFPELSICLLNLTPMCSRCQGEKSSDFLTDNDERMFLHPYYDEIGQCFFNIGIRPPFSSPSAFIINLNDEVEVGIRSVVERHIRGVAFKERLEEFCEIKHLHLLKIMADEREDEDPFPAARLIRKFLRQEQKKTYNAWAAIYFQSVLDTPELLDYLDNGELPDYL